MSSRTATIIDQQPYGQRAQIVRIELPKTPAEQLIDDAQQDARMLAYGGVPALESWRELEAHCRIICGDI